MRLPVFNQRGPTFICGAKLEKLSGTKIQGEVKNNQGTSVQTSIVGMQEKLHILVYLESLDKLVVQLHPAVI